jgi:hypothetical protein
MPLRCIDKTAGGSIHAFDLSDSAWAELRALNRQSWHLRTGCCGVPVVLKRSKLGTKFFAHKHTPKHLNCGVVKETEDHLRLKRVVVEVARNLGWRADTEVVGDGWRADVLASKGEETVAIEVQLSRQPDEVTLRRQACFTAAGIRSLWLFRQEAIPHHRDIPAARVSSKISDGDNVTVPLRADQQTFPLSTFLEHFFAKRFRFGVPLGSLVNASVSWSTAPCWKCRGATSQMIQLTLRVGDFTGVCTTRVVARYPALLGIICTRIGVNLCETNKCTCCGAHIGNFAGCIGPNAIKSAETFRLSADGPWLDLLFDPDCGLAYWAVQAPP